LDRLLAHLGFGSRREVARLIRAGRATIEGTTERDPATKVDDDAIVAVDGVDLERRGQWHLLCHKPGGVVTSTRDPRDPCILELVPLELFRPDYAPVGRLDKDTTGLLLLTTDGELAHRLTHPRHHVAKRYVATLSDPVSSEDIEVFASGELALDGDPLLPALLDVSADPRVVGVTLREGRYHQVKRMFAARGNRVVALARVAFGPLVLPPDLEPGEFRRLHPQEERDLYAAVGISR
jgi:16S rRNA pseudouridine516 synthase